VRVRLEKKSYANCGSPVEDGKEMQLDLEKMKIKDIQVEVDRHSRILRRKEELSG